jgi:hypothetical protein
MDGRLVKGYTFDFSPSQARFHIFAQPTASGPSTLVLVKELKALFFVRDLVGNPARQDGQEFHSGEAPGGQHVEVRFRDGEVIVGTADTPPTDALGFFLVPADPESNNLRVYVVAPATRAVYPLPSVAGAGAFASRADRAPRDASAVPLLPGRLLRWLTR